MKKNIKKQKMIIHALLVKNATQAKYLDIFMPPLIMKRHQLPNSEGSISVAWMLYMYRTVLLLCSSVKDLVVFKPELAASMWETVVPLVEYVLGCLSYKLCIVYWNGEEYEVWNVSCKLTPAMFKYICFSVDITGFNC